MYRVLAALFGVFAAMPAHALSVTPITIEMAAAGKSSRATVTITNPSPDATAIEPSFSRVEISESGASNQTAGGDENFLIMPMQALIPPGASQTFRLQWVGPPDLPQSESYFVTFNQLPVKGLAEHTGITLLTSFSVAVNVAPTFIRPEIELIDIQHRQDGTAVTVQNPTAAHALLKHAVITVFADGAAHTVDASDVERMYGAGLVQPWKRRTFVLPFPFPTPARTLSASIDYKPPAPH